MKVLKTIPFLRVIIPFIAGILFGIIFQFPVISWFYFFLFLVLLTLFCFTARIKNKLFFLIAADIFLVFYGSNLVGLANTSLQDSFYANELQADSLIKAVVVINDIPVTKQKFTKCSIRILQVTTTKGYKKVSGNSLAYFKRSEKDSLLKPGNILLLKTKFLNVMPSQNPYTFDYKSYLYNKQVYHTLFVDTNSFEVLKVNKPALNFFWAIGLDCKQYLLQSLKKSPLNENAYAVCCALLTGYDDEIDKGIMEAFSHSGTLHVLSVSGLHTGLIYLVLSFLFDLVDRKRKYRFSRFVIIAFILWFFALITGFSAPVLRAVLMFTLLAVGKLYFRNSPANQVNILLVSAFILLMYNPFYITDVGFLLSYFALLGLICFQPGLSALWQPKYSFVNAVWQSTTASFAATISTLPFTLFYFKQFAVWFFVCNIVVVPATFVILMLALLVVLKVGFAAFVVNYLMYLLTLFIGLFNSAGYGFIDAIDFNSTDAVYLALLILVLSACLKYRSYTYLRTVFILLICWQITSLAFSYWSKTKSLFTVYSLKNKSCITIKNKTSALITPIDTADYNYHIKPHVVSFNYPNLQIKSGVNFLKTDKEIILTLDKPGYYPKVNFAEVTVLVLSNNFKLSAVNLSEFKKLRALIIDASNNRYVTKKTEELCIGKAFTIHNVRNKGAYLLDL